ncbi:MAG: hypothetical protein CVT94_02050 [Bacteroidetes bacterium HGW-Bacteroidetes-11]|jgi:hypothetical protein|nr:MAG: hypothetical protein CVT94_02050 [Bacteroidetes bacterium HGW-Bacteroidetes-11]
MKIVAFKTGKPKSFNYRPVYYDKKKDEMEERLKRYKEPKEAEEDRLRTRIKESWHQREVKTKKLSTKTFYIYIIVALALIYYIFLR